MGVKERFEVDYDNEIYRVSALWLTNSKGQTLLAKRAMTKKYDPGLWGPAAVGTLEDDETYESNIYKEAEEEIGLTGIRFQELAKVLVDDGHHYFLQWYGAMLDRDVDSFVRQEEEVDELAWIDIEQMKQELKTKSDKYVPAMGVIVEKLGL